MTLTEAMLLHVMEKHCLMYILLARIFVKIVPVLDVNIRNLAVEVTVLAVFVKTTAPA